MPTYHITRDVTYADGSQTFKCVAESKEEALQKFIDGDDEFVDESVEVQQLSEPDINDVYMEE